MSTRVRVLAVMFPQKMEPLIVRMERLAEAAHKDQKLADVYDRICESWYLSDEDDDAKALVLFAADVARVEKAAGFK